ncbi:MAG TPA: PAS domain S-box protein [Ramlibacter sp.]|nr:PAS domain S-box protein [Ramlibacter sp.]
MDLTLPDLDPPWLAPVAQALDELLWTCNAADGRISFANAAFHRFWQAAGLPPPASRQELLQRVHAGDRDRLQRAQGQLPAAGYREEYRIPLPARADAPARLAHLSEQAVPIPGGPAHVIHLARDVSWQFDTTALLREEISRRADAERNLDDVTQRLEALIATANDAVITIDERSRIIDWNQAAERMFGWRRDEALGQVLTELIVPHVHRPQHHSGIDRYLADGSSRLFGRRVETTALRRSGEPFDVELSVWPVRTAGKITFSSFVRDISRRKTAERALAESEAKYRKVVENVGEGILVTAAGRIVYANPRALELTGMDEATATSRPFIEFIHPDDRERVLGNHIRRMRGETVENRYQFRVLHRSGDVRWVEISGVVFEWHNAPATLNFLTDVTQRRRDEEEVRSTVARERELSELKSRFVAVASHEFRTPLAAILSSVELLDDYGTRMPEAERREVVGLVKQAVARMNGMVEQVLLTSRLEAGQFGFDPQPQRVADLLVQVGTELDQAHSQAPRVSLRCEDGDRPRRLDARLVRHVLMNLLNNALKYSPADTPVTCTAAPDGDTLVLQVQDRGIGIPAADLPRLFERFHRGTNVGNIQGTGIGLHIVRECVQLHGGSIDVTSQPGQGTTFTVRLPAPRGD